MKSKEILKILRPTIEIFYAIFSIFILIFLLLYLSDANFSLAFKGFVNSSIGGRNNAYLFSTFSKMALISGMAIAALVAFRGGLFNIGGEGQLVVGGFACAFTGLLVSDFGFIGILISIISGMVAGATWALLSGFLTVYMGVPLLVGSLLLNYPARFITSYLVSHPFRDVQSGLPQTFLLSKNIWLPYFPNTRLDLGILIIFFVYVICLIIFYYTKHGYHSKNMGHSLSYVKLSGLPTKKIVFKTLALSGAIAGIVGSVAVLGIHHRFTDGMLVQPLYAWTGIIAALLVNLNLWFVPLAGFFFAAIYTGAAGMERIAQVPKEIATVIQAVIILFVVGKLGSLTNLSSSKGDKDD